VKIKPGANKQSMMTIIAEAAMRLVNLLKYCQNVKKFVVVNTIKTLNKGCFLNYIRGC